MVRGEVFDPDRAASGHDGRVLDGVPELADIAGPGARASRGEDLFREMAVGSGRQSGLLQEMLGQDGDVVGAVAERRQVDREHAQAKEKVVPKLAGRHELGQRPVGCGDHPDIGRPGLRVADRRDLPVLDGAEELDLERGRNIADLVQKDRAAVGQFEQAL